TTVLHPLSLHDALPIWTHFLAVAVLEGQGRHVDRAARQAGDGADVDLGQLEAEELVALGRRGELLPQVAVATDGVAGGLEVLVRSEEHTSELQSRENLV